MNQQYPVRFPGWSRMCSACFKVFASLCFLSTLVACHAAQGLKGDYYSGSDFTTFVGTRTDANLDFSWGTTAPYSGVTASDYSVRWTGSIQPTHAERYVFTIKATHAFRLWVNDTLLIDTWSGMTYDADWLTNGNYERTAQATLPLQAGVTYPIRVEFGKKNQTSSVPATFKLFWASPSQANQIISPTAFTDVLPAKRAQVARTAQSLYQSMGVVFQRPEDLTQSDFDLQEAALLDLGVYTVRMGLYPWAREKGTRDRFLELYNTLGIKITAIVRESFATNDSATMMAQILEDVKYVQPSLLMVEGPNEPSLGSERFEYRGHGYSHSSGSVVGEGWSKGVVLFMSDLSATLFNDAQTTNIPVLNSAMADSPWKNPMSSDTLADKAAANSIDFNAILDVSNCHKYHMDYPENYRLQNFVRGMRKLADNPLKPMATTETGNNTGTASHDIVTEDVDARYLLRHYFVNYITGFDYSYKFALKYDATNVTFGLLRSDLSAKPSYNALKNAITILKDTTSITPGAFNYTLTGDTTNIWQTLVQKSDGKFFLILWQAANSQSAIPAARALTLNFVDTATRARQFTPKTSANATTDTANPASLALSVPDHPLIIEITPGAPTAPSAPTNLTATAGNTTVDLSWTASSGATSYNVSRSTTGGGSYASVATGVTATTYADSGLTNGTTYYYVVSATNSVGTSGNSNEASATPSAPSQTTATFTSIGSEDGYIVESGEETNVGGSVSSTASTTSALRGGDDGKDRKIKTVLSFDTSLLPDNAVIVSATLKLKRGSLTGTNPFSILGACFVDIKGGSGLGGSTAIAATDYEAAVDAAEVASMSNPAANGDWSTGAINATGRGFINRTGKTQFRVYFDVGDNDNRSADYLGWYSGENATAANRPVLEIVYQ